MYIDEGTNKLFKIKSTAQITTPQMFLIISDSPNRFLQVLKSDLNSPTVGILNFFQLEKSKLTLQNISIT
jgi:hypothetical protein